MDYVLSVVSPLIGVSAVTLLWRLGKSSQQRTEIWESFVNLEHARHSAENEPLFIKLRTQNISQDDVWVGKIVEVVNAGGSVKDVSVFADDQTAYAISLNGRYKSHPASPTAIKTAGQILPKDWEARLTIRKLAKPFQKNERVNFTLSYTTLSGERRRRSYCYSEAGSTLSEI